MSVATMSGYAVDHGWVPHKPETWTFRYACLRKDRTLEHYLGYSKGGEPQFREVPCEAGQRVKIVMVSRFGDVGITEDLNAEVGYGARVQLDDLCNFSNEIAEVGDRVRLTAPMVNENSAWMPVEQDMPAGLEGAVVIVSMTGPKEFHQISVRWDNGRGLGLIPHTDKFVVISQQEIPDAHTV
jgi:hypothetical protein